MSKIGTDHDALLKELEGELSGPRVVAIGGGEGLSRLLEAALTYTGRLDAIVTVSDDGGSSGRLAPHLDIPPPGDIRKCLLALTPDDSTWKRLFEYRFEGADVAGHSLGNLILAGLADIEGSFERALVRVEQLLGARGSVIPASSEHLTLEVESEGETTSGQVAVSLNRGKVDALRLHPETAEASLRAVEAIESSDVIILGPGSLITSLTAAMCVPGITEAINESNSHLIYVSNLVTQDGETLGMDGVDHLEAMLRLTGVRPPRTIVANNTEIEIAQPLGQIEFDKELTATYGADLKLSDLVDESSPRPSHDPVKLGRALREIS